MRPAIGTDVIYKGKKMHVQDTCASGFARIGEVDENGIVWDTIWVPYDQLCSETTT